MTMMILFLVLLLSVSAHSSMLDRHGTLSNRKSRRGDFEAQIVAAGDRNSANVYSYSMNQHPQRPSPGRRQQQGGMVGLLKQASSASIGVLFALLAWRALTAWSMASQFKNKLVRLMSVSPAVTLLTLNVADTSHLPS